jgi:signal peptidase I
MAEPNSASAGKAFFLNLLAPGLGHSYAGNSQRGLTVQVVTLGLVGLAAALGMLPPINLPVLILMALPVAALPLWWLTTAASAVIQARRGATAALPSSVLLAGGAILTITEVASLALLLYNFSSIGWVRTTDDSMAPTTLQGDMVVTWRDYYHGHLPERGDVAVVKLPGVQGDRIMRIVGLPGDSILGVLGVLNINGKPVGRESDGDFGWRDADGTHRSAPQYIETLPGGTSYHILQSAEGILRGTLLGASLRIPDGYYFVIGDNRDTTKSSWDFGMLPGLVIGDRPTVIVSSSRGSLIGRSVQP